MTISIRIATPADHEALTAIRTSVRENHMSVEQMAAIGIMEQSVGELITSVGRGWIGFVDGVDAGFSIAHAGTGSIFAMFVRPEYEGLGLGRRLLTLAEKWLAEKGFSEIWLEAGKERGLRAHGFYERCGWRQDGFMPDGQLRFVKALEAR